MRDETTSGVGDGCATPRRSTSVAPDVDATTTIGSVCASHAECDAIAFAYCASTSGGGAQRAGACMSCDDCALHADGIDGACPSTCATRTMTSGVGATGADEFF